MRNVERGKKPTEAESDMLYYFGRYILPPHLGKVDLENVDNALSNSSLSWQLISYFEMGEINHGEFVRFVYAIERYCLERGRNKYSEAMKSFKILEVYCQGLSKGLGLAAEAERQGKRLDSILQQGEPLWEYIQRKEAEEAKRSGNKKGSS